MWSKNANHQINQIPALPDFFNAKLPNKSSKVTENRYSHHNSLENSISIGQISSTIMCAISFRIFKKLQNTTICKNTDQKPLISKQSGKNSTIHYLGFLPTWKILKIVNFVKNCHIWRYGQIHISLFNQQFNDT